MKRWSRQVEETAYPKSWCLGPPWKSLKILPNMLNIWNLVEPTKRVLLRFVMHDIKLFIWILPFIKLYTNYKVYSVGLN